MFIQFNFSFVKKNYVHTKIHEVNFTYNLILTCSSYFHFFCCRFYETKGSNLSSLYPLVLFFYQVKRMYGFPLFIGWVVLHMLVHTLFSFPFLFRHGKIFVSKNGAIYYLQILRPNTFPSLNRDGIFFSSLILETKNSFRL